MQNMKNAVLVLTAFLLLFPYKLMAENKVISIEDGWDIENDEDEDGEDRFQGGRQTAGV